MSITGGTLNMKSTNLAINFERQYSLDKALLSSTMLSYSLAYKGEFNVCIVSLLKTN